MFKTLINIHWTKVNVRTPISMTMASIILPMTVIKSNMFQGSLKKFCIVSKWEKTKKKLLILK